jgi:hypothetical protein
MTKIYIAGGMRGYEDLNFPAFNEMAKALAELGWDPVNPVDINPDPETPYAECMRRDIAALVECEAIYMLNGWAESKGATLEHQIAEALELEIYYEGVDYSDEDDQ